jgi:peptidoglycan/xylan/chitin deacetylase (PgdA/CDA1 family)
VIDASPKRSPADVARTAGWRVDILAYHSISDGRGPGCTAPGLFRQQLAVLADLGYTGVSLARFMEEVGAGGTISKRRVVLTFDDGLEDFAQVAWPELVARGWSATAFLPAAKMGGTVDWRPAGGMGGRRLMSWETAAALARADVELGAHGITHCDLTRLTPEAAQREIEESGRIIEERAGCRVESFAAPYGRTNARIRACIRRRYRVGVGTAMARAASNSDLSELPRIEMCYFRESRRWREYLARDSTVWLRVRRSARGVRALASRVRTGCSRGLAEVATPFRRID